VTGTEEIDFFSLRILSFNQAFFKENLMSSSKHSSRALIERIIDSDALEICFNLFDAFS